MNLLEQYENMLKEAEVDQEKTAEMEVLEKYASVAEELLEENYGDDYNAKDVEDLAYGLIEKDAAEEEAMEKIAEIDQMGRIMAHAFVDELNSME